MERSSASVVPHICAHTRAPSLAACLITSASLPPRNVVAGEVRAAADWPLTIAASSSGSTSTPLGRTELSPLLTVTMCRHRVEVGAVEGVTATRFTIHDRLWLPVLGSPAEPERLMTYATPFRTAMLSWPPQWLPAMPSRGEPDVAAEVNHCRVPSSANFP